MLTSHPFTGPYQACTHDGCELRREADVHAAAAVQDYLTARAGVDKDWPEED